MLPLGWVGGSSEPTQVELTQQMQLVLDQWSSGKRLEEEFEAQLRGLGRRTDGSLHVRAHVCACAGTCVFVCACVGACVLDYCMGAFAIVFVFVYL